MKRLVASALTLSMLLAAPLAHAISDEGKATLQSLDYWKTQVDLKNRPFKDGDSDYAVSQGMGQYESKLKTVKERLEKVPAADRKDPMYEGYAKWVAEFESTVKRWQGERGQNATNLKNKAQAEEAYRADARDNAGALEMVKAARGTYTYSLDAAQMLTKWKAAEKLTAFAAKCDKEYAPVDAASYYGRDKIEHCKNAAEWKAVLTPFFEARSIANVKRLGTELESSVNRVKNGETTYEGQLKRMKAPADYIAQVKGPYEALFQAMGKPLPAEMFAPIDTAAKGYPAAVTASQAKVAYKPGKFADATVTNAVKAAFTTKGVKVLKISQSFGDWSIRKNEYAFPTHRIRDSIVLGQVTGESFCRLFEVTAQQQYAGGGRYSSNTAVDLRSEPDFKIASCK